MLNGDWGGIHLLLGQFELGSLFRTLVNQPTTLGLAILISIVSFKYQIEGLAGKTLPLGYVLVPVTLNGKSGYLHCALNIFIGATVFLNYFIACLQPQKP